MTKHAWHLAMAFWELLRLAYRYRGRSYRTDSCIYGLPVMITSQGLVLLNRLPEGSLRFVQLEGLIWRCLTSSSHLCKRGMGLKTSTTEFLTLSGNFDFASMVYTFMGMVIPILHSVEKCLEKKPQSEMHDTLRYSKLPHNR